MTTIINKFIYNFIKKESNHNYLRKSFFYFAMYYAKIS
jgi:hypothetical protein